MENEENCNSPIYFVGDNIIQIDGLAFVEISTRIYENIRPGQFVNYQGVIFDSYTNRFRHPSKEPRGYLMTYVVFNDGHYYHVNVHRLIMLVFNYQPGCVNHIDGNKSNNSFSNLEWCTQLENTRHAYRTGLNKNVGENHHQAKLTEKEVNEICQELENPQYYGQLAGLAAKYNVTENTIHKIASGKIWKEVSSDYNLDYSQNGIESILTEDQVREICEELSKGRYHGQCVELGNKYNVCPSTIKEIIQRRSWTNISKDYEFPSSINNKLSEEQIHQICQVMQEFGYFDSDVYKVILERTGLEPSSKLRHNIKRLHRRDPHCYYNITSQYYWN